MTSDELKGQSCNSPAKTKQQSFTHTCNADPSDRNSGDKNDQKGKNDGTRDMTNFVRSPWSNNFFAKESIHDRQNSEYKPDDDCVKNQYLKLTRSVATIDNQLGTGDKL